ncbi:MAG: hypothetical protein LBF41_00935 [Deltaproteobacteria bacterium]|jgi:hypothetical protein|nr:hypothetical protein [Deltaproteobacteria bacterium]
MSRQHTYLIEPGLWAADGIYYDDADQPHVQRGELLVEHAPDLWTIDSQMKISGQDRRDFNTRYEVKPLPEGVSFTDWKMLSGGPEPVFGLFVFVEECVLMPWQSRSNRFWGQEVLFSKSPDEYLSRGFSFIQDKKVYSWAVTLKRQS